LGKKGVNAHSGHELKKPMRATKVLLEVMEDCKANAAKDGSIGIELQKKTLIAMSEAFGGEDAMNESTFNHVRRKLEKTKLWKRGQGVPETFDVLIRDGESVVSINPADCHPDLLAVLGLLLRVQKKFPETYINVRFDKHLSYVFFALPEMRRKGSLFGDIRLFDDKHGVSQNGYHLASSRRIFGARKKCRSSAWVTVWTEGSANDTDFQQRDHWGFPQYWGLSIFLIFFDSFFDSKKICSRSSLIPSKQDQFQPLAVMEGVQALQKKKKKKKKR
jgi:hypothetical protein